MNIIELNSRMTRIERAIRRLVRCFIGGALAMSGALYLHWPTWVGLLCVALVGFMLGLRRS